MKKAFLALLLFSPFVAQADGSIGVIGAVSESVYKETDNQAKFLPNIGYEGENFFLQLPEVGYRFLPKQSPQNFSVGLSYESSNFDPDDSDDINIQQLDDRDDSIMAFASYKIGPLSTKLAQDISGEHDGYYAQIALGYPLPVGAWKVIPSISYRYMDSKMSNHLFGVSRSESANTGGTITAYDSGAIAQIRYGIRGIYPLSESVNLMLGINHTRFDSEILKSPIVEDNTITSVLAGVIFSF
ncbi:MipA/OmpV family protein [Marinomonas sp. A3A]|jgi:MipA family protein|uniref:MipA/OmpV family protein n=1 Tax=Marinomonas TaxID=28253 RepID=UPI001BB3B5E4|nr:MULTISPECIES: MipA/OmpV family protein [Marinomonas]QUX92836.1 MipA/OmpV family protein [Marinomonas sp. A3A]